MASNLAETDRQQLRSKAAQFGTTCLTDHEAFVASLEDDELVEYVDYCDRVHGAVSS